MERTNHCWIDENCLVLCILNMYIYVIYHRTDYELPSGDLTLLLNMIMEIMSLPIKMVVFWTYISLPEGSHIYPSIF